VIVIIFTLLGEFMGLVPILNIIWPVINVLISVLIIAPLTTAWWTRLYMTRTDKKLFLKSSE
jgi:hypothetical protein